MCIDGLGFMRRKINDLSNMLRMQCLQEMHFYPLIGQCVVLLTEVSAEFPNPQVEVISELLLTFIQKLLVPKDITPPRVDSEVVNETYLFCFFVFFLPGAE